MSNLTTDQHDKLANFLTERAKTRSLVTYDEAGAVFGVAGYSNHLNQALDEISYWSQREYGVMLSAVVISRIDGFPKEHFFELADELGRAYNDRLEFWVRELARVHGWQADSIGGR